MLCLLIMLINGCAQQKPLNARYPLWGRPINLPATDGQTRHLQILEPKDSEACILIVHGMNEYIGRYGEIAAYFADRYTVAGLDLSAHGLSNPVIARADENIKAGNGKQDISEAFLEQSRIRDLQPMRQDFERALSYLQHHCHRRSADQAMPVFILSHSLGSLVAASWLLQTEDSELKHSIAGMIFSGPAFSVTEVPGWRGWLQTPLVRFTYHTHEHFLNPHDEALPLLLFNQLLALVTVPIQDGLIELLSLPGMRQLFSPSTPDWVVDYLSDWEAERRRHNADPFIIRRSVLRYVLAVEKEVIRFRRRMAEFNTPYLLIYSEHDPITPAWGNEDFVAASRQNHRDNDVMMLAGAHHHEQLFSEPALRRQVLEKIASWLLLRTAEH
ncbi:alpha/beta hydrolase [Methylomarinum sp. Ch1-1]|uniref:Alpha/beta hydrolase n=1 Tax=Methylomarinum roseum TaxID=3067653 RepID=A0AAU7NWQ2_9GAMM|nr:alpha/beta hydrolase [Methylomarinum sp. Ch1-1]MDP4522538.1 alpha/beta hydrolase [Methylomarinum sp. Ch1-1]